MRFPVGAAACGAAMLFLLTGCEALERLAEKRDGNAPQRAATDGEAKPKVAKAPARAPAPARGLAARSVLGGSQGEVTRLLGEPGAVRNDPPALVWEYTSAACKLDVFFYFDIGNKDFRALAYKLYPDQATGEAEHACLTGIRSAKGQ